MKLLSVRVTGDTREHSKFNLPFCFTADHNLINLHILVPQRLHQFNGYADIILTIFVAI